MPLVGGSTGNYVSEYSTLFTTTMQVHRRTLVDQISDAIPFFWWMKQKNRRKTQLGGESILQPLMYKLNPVQRFSGLERLETATKDGLTNAVVLWKHYHTSVVIPMIHIRHNMGEGKVLDLMDAQVEQAKISFRDAINLDMVANNTHSGGDVRGIEGLATLITDRATDRIYGGITEAGDNDWWKCQTQTVGTNFAVGGLNAMRSLYFDCVRGNDKPDLILGTQAMYENYDSALYENKRYVNTQAADAGFETLAFHGATIMFDRDVAADRAYFINSNYINNVVDPEIEFSFDDFVKPHDVWALMSRGFYRGNLACSNRARQGLLLNTD